jgi:protein involved in polysaccharide export with SLBB domain
MNRNSLRQRIACLLVAAWGIPLLVGAQTEPATTPAPADAGNTSLSANVPAKRARWQERLTLGAGDTLNLALFGMPDTAQKEVPIGPDGRLTFLQARDIQAAGLTIDELRVKLDAALAGFYQNPRTIITPGLFRSKKYFVLGAVPNRGVFALDRPLTVVEALARAGGLETGVYQRNTVELADLQHSFLIRDHKRMAVDFERLFQHGDLSQNVALEPDDYLYFALATANEIYVLGEVTSPGLAAFLPHSTAISAISARGGFTARSYKSRVLVVRGSLNRPETFIVDASAILAGKAPDFKLQPKDIVYVHVSPWIKASEIVDAAATAFIQGVVVGVVTRKIPINVNPILP